MLNNVIKVIVIVVLLGALAWCALCVISNTATPEGELKMPKPDKAAYSVYIKNTGNLILTGDYETHGTEVGSRIFVLKGYWEVSGQEFVFKGKEIVLNEAIFGEITVRRR